MEPRKVISEEEMRRRIAWANQQTSAAATAAPRVDSPSVSVALLGQAELTKMLYNRVMLRGDRFVNPVYQGKDVRLLTAADESALLSAAKYAVVCCSSLEDEHLADDLESASSAGKPCCIVVIEDGQQYEFGNITDPRFQVKILSATIPLDFKESHQQHFINQIFEGLKPQRRRTITDMLVGFVRPNSGREFFQDSESLVSRPSEAVEGEAIKVSIVGGELEQRNAFIQRFFAVDPAGHVTNAMLMHEEQAYEFRIYNQEMSCLASSTLILVLDDNLEMFQGIHQAVLTSDQNDVILMKPMDEGETLPADTIGELGHLELHCSDSENFIERLTEDLPHVFASRERKSTITVL